MKRTSNVTVDGRQLAQMRMERGLTQAALGAALGLSGTRIEQIERQERAGMYARNFAKLVTILGVPVEELRRRLLVDGDAQSSGENGHKAPPATKGNVPVESLMRDVKILNHIAAGPFQDERTRDFSIVRDGGWVRAPVGKAQAFALWVSGDSMEPRYRDGDLVVFKSVDAERDPIVDGSDYAIQLAGEDFYEQSFKRLYSDPREGEGPYSLWVIACPINPKHKPKKTRLLRTKISRLGIVFAVYPRVG